MPTHTTFRLNMWVVSGKGNVSALTGKIHNAAASPEIFPPFGGRIFIPDRPKDHTPSASMRSERGGGGGSGGEDDGAVAWTPSELRALRQSIRDNGLDDWRTLGDWGKVGYVATAQLVQAIAVILDLSCLS